MAGEMSAERMKPLCKKSNCQVHYGRDVYGQAYHVWWHALCAATTQGQRTGRVHQVYSTDGHYRVRKTKRRYPLVW